MRDGLYYALVALLRFLLYPLYFLSGLIPRRPQLWVFGSWGGHRFADNAAAFFLYCNRTLGDEVVLVWISRRYRIVSELRAAGYKAHWWWSPAGIYCCLRARTYIFDCFVKDINYWLSRNAVKVNLWSGVPLKTFERDIDRPTTRYYTLFHGSKPMRWLMQFMMPWHVDRFDLLICTSPRTQSIMCSAFDVSVDKVAITGYPRNDVLVRPEVGGAHQSAAMPARYLDAVAKGEKIFLYLPTFRDSGKPYLQFDWRRLDDFLTRNRAVFCYKFHPVDRTTVDAQSDRVIALPHDLDVYRILNDTSALISDYSSIVFDYLLLEKPIIYYIPDLQDFLASSRALNFEFDEIAVGAQCRNFDELIVAMRAVVSKAPVSEAFASRRRAALELLHTYRDGASNDRVLTALDQRVLNGPTLEQVSRIQ